MLLLYQLKAIIRQATNLMLAVIYTKSECSLDPAEELLGAKFCSECVSDVAVLLKQK